MDKLFKLFGFHTPLCTIFDSDDGTGNANNSNASGGSDVSSAGGGGGDKGENKGGDSSSKQEETHTIKVDGVDRQVSLDELKTLASKAGGADARFQEAAELKKSSEGGARIGALIEGLSGDGEPKESDVRELSSLIGVNPDEFLKFLSEEDPPQKGASGKISAADITDALTEALGATPAELRARSEHSNKRHVSDAQKELREISDKAVDKDEIIGKMIVGESKDEVLTAVKDMVAEDVLRKIQDGMPYGADMVAASVQRVRSQLTKLGIPNKPAQQPIVLGLGPGQGIPLDFQADEPIKRVASTQDGNEENIVKRYLQSAVKSWRRKQ